MVLRDNALMLCRWVRSPHPCMYVIRVRASSGRELLLIAALLSRSRIVTHTILYRIEPNAYSGIECGSRRGSTCNALVHAEQGVVGGLASVVYLRIPMRWCIAPKDPYFESRR